MEKIVILDFGSQYTQLIARRVRELQVYCEIYPYHSPPDLSPQLKGVILSGSPFSVHDNQAPKPNLQKLLLAVPVLAICYGAQLLAHTGGGSVLPSNKREYGRTHLINFDSNHVLFKGLSPSSQVWMSHGDTIESLPNGATTLASTQNVYHAAYQLGDSPVYGIQFHPEVTHSLEGKILLRNFIIAVCQCAPKWTPTAFIEETVQNLQLQLQSDKVVMGLSGGVDSTVAAMLLHKAIGANLHCIFIDNGLLRKNEFTQVLHAYRNLGLNIKGVEAEQQFLTALEGKTDPEVKRKAIGKTFIDVFDQEASQIIGAKWLGQGTIYPDVIESVAVNGPSVTIKSHHNVGGLPDNMALKVVEPLRALFKDEVRKVGLALGIDQNILNRHPFPGPGLAIRILGDVTAHKVKMLQAADAIFIEALKENDLYDKVWQAGAILLPIKAVGVMGDERTYEQVICLRAVESVDGMTADWSHLPYEFLAKVSNEIINKVKGINRVVYDISSKPPATIEWE